SSERESFSPPGIGRLRNHRRSAWLKPAIPAAMKREEHLRRGDSVSLLKQVREGKQDQLNGIKKSVHRHGDKNRAAPLVGKSETAGQDEKRQDRRHVVMSSGKEK